MVVMKVDLKVDCLVVEMVWLKVGSLAEYLVEEKAVLLVALLVVLRVV